MRRLGELLAEAQDHWRLLPGLEALRGPACRTLKTLRCGHKITNHQEKSCNLRAISRIFVNWFDLIGSWVPGYSIEIWFGLQSIISFVWLRQRFARVNADKIWSPTMHTRFHALHYWNKASLVLLTHANSKFSNSNRMIAQQSIRIAKALSSRLNLISRSAYKSTPTTRSITSGLTWKNNLF